MALMEWFKVNGYNYMYGSLRIDTPIQRLVFVELLALASISRVRRTVCLSEGVPYPRLMLAGTIGITEDQLNEAISHHIKQDIARLHINEWGGIEIIKWDIYQSASYDRVRKHRERKKQCIADVTSVTPDNINSYDNCTENVTNGNNSVTVEKRIEEKRIEEKRKEETDNNKKKPHSGKHFVKPTPEEVTLYAKSIGFPLDGQNFCDSNDAKGWVVGKNRTPMKDWMAVVRTWFANYKERNPAPAIEVPIVNWETLVMDRDKKDKLERKALNANTNRKNVVDSL